MAVACAVFALCPGAGYSADARDHALVEKEFDTSFHQMMADPGNVDATMHYANLAIELENYEAAIPALERMLFFNPDLYDVKLELGVLYYNLHSYDVAREYFTAAKAEGAPDDVVEQADGYLEKLGG